MQYRAVLLQTDHSVRRITYRRALGEAESRHILLPDCTANQGCACLMSVSAPDSIELRAGPDQPAGSAGFGSVRLWA
jgi:hypothetical protein